MKPRAVNSAPWPAGLYPVSVRGRTETGNKWLTGSRARVVGGEGLWYDTREPVTDEWHALDTRTVQVDLLMAPGDFKIEFAGSLVGERVVSVHVDDPFDQLKLVDWKKEKLYVRAGTWDDYISHEGSYGALTMQPGDVVADMGAHIGVFARRAAKAGARKVYCWEPETINCAVLQRNLELTSIEYEIKQACVVDDRLHMDGADLWMDSAGDGNQGRNALHSIVKYKSSRLAVRVPTVNWAEELNRVQPTVLKVDVEGAELDYDWSLVPRSVREIAVELEKSKKDRMDSHEVIANDLKALGFELIRHSSGWSVMQVWRRADA